MLHDDRAQPPKAHIPPSFVCVTADHPNAGSTQHQHQHHSRHQTTMRHANHHRDTLTVGNTNATSTLGNIHTTANPTNDKLRYRHLQHPYHHHHDPGTE